MIPTSPAVCLFSSSIVPCYLSLWSLGVLESWSLKLFFFLLRFSFLFVLFYQTRGLILDLPRIPVVAVGNWELGEARCKAAVIARRKINPLLCLASRGVDLFCIRSPAPC
jgi:hypothetical protein